MVKCYNGKHETKVLRLSRTLCIDSPYNPLKGTWYFMYRVVWTMSRVVVCQFNVSAKSIVNHREGSPLESSPFGRLWVLFWTTYIMKAGHLNTQSKQVDWSYNHWNNIKKDLIKISLWSLRIYQMATTLNRRSLSI